MPAAATAATRPVVLLGASNVSISLRLILRLLRGGLGGDLHVLAAAGHGRSYAKPTRVFGRGLPGILKSGVFDSVPPSPHRPLALLTDAGNDLLYGTEPATLAGWVAACLDRLPAGADAILTLPPLARAERLTAWQYHAARAVLFPGRPPVSWPEMRGRARELHARLRELGAARGCRVIDPPAAWYGFDPIHVRRGRRPAAWSAIFARWDGFEPAGAASLPRLPPVWGKAARCAVFGRERRTEQPVWNGGGVMLSLF